MPLPTARPQSSRRPDAQTCPDPACARLPHKPPRGAAARKPAALGAGCTEGSPPPSPRPALTPPRFPRETSAAPDGPRRPRESLGSRTPSLREGNASSPRPLLLSACEPGPPTRPETADGDPRSPALGPGGAHPPVQNPRRVAHARLRCPSSAEGNAPARGAERGGAGTRDVEPRVLTSPRPSPGRPRCLDDGRRVGTRAAAARRRRAVDPARGEHAELVPVSDLHVRVSGGPGGGGRAGSAGQTGVYNAV